jgi:thiosulfate reductase cytochrome b subunit
MKEASKRTIVRSIHLVLTIPLLGYIYSPYDQLPLYAWKVRLVFVPMMVLSGLWMWKGHVVRRFFSKRPPTREVASKLAA